MSTFLELCQAFRQEAAISGADGTPAAVTGQIGELKRCVDWIAAAYEDVQNSQERWEFLRSDFSFPTIAGVNEYTPTGAGLPTLQTWKEDSLRCFLASAGVTDEQWLTGIPWPQMRDAFLYGANRNITGRPTHFAIRPNDSIVFWPIPNEVYTVVGEYWTRPHTMSANADQPVIPLAFHRVILWRALMMYGAYESAPEVYAHGELEFKKLMGRLRRDQLEAIESGEPLA